MPKCVTVLLLAVALGLALQAVPAWAARYAYVTNFGSHNVSQYSLDVAGLLGTLSPPAVGAGTNPMGIALSPDGRSAYVANFTSNSVSQYDVSAEDGTLTAKSPETVSAGTKPQYIAVSPDGRSVYVTNSFSATISQYDVSAADGKLTAKSPPTVATGGTSPWGIAVSPDGRSAYVASGGSDQVFQYDVSAADGTLTAKSPATVPAGTSPVGIALSPDGRSAYVTNDRSTDVSQYDISAVDGTLTAKSPATVLAEASPIYIALSPDGGSAYVINADVNDDDAYVVSQYDVSAADGTLTAKSQPPIEAGMEPGAIALSPDGRSAYVTNYRSESSSNVSQYDVSAVDGTLTAKSQPTVGAGANPDLQAVVVAPGQAPTAVFTASGGVSSESAVFASGTPASFDASASTNASTYEWSFGDGTTRTTTTATTTHQYPAPGTYDVTLTTRNDCATDAVFTGNTVFTGQTVYCNGPSSAQLTKSVVVYAHPAPRPATPSVPPDPSVPARAEIPTYSATLSANGTVTLTIECVASTECDGKLTLETAKPVAMISAGLAGATTAKKRMKRIVLLGKRTFRVPAGATQKIKTRIYKKGQKLIRKKKRVRAKATTEITNAPSMLTISKIITLGASRGRATSAKLPEVRVRSRS